MMAYLDIMQNLDAIFAGDWVENLAVLSDGCVDCVVTSPPYWGLRDYGVKGQVGLEKTVEEFVEKMVDGFREVRRVLADHGTLWLNLGDSYSSGGRKNYGPDLISKSSGLTNRSAKINRNTPSWAKQKDLLGVPWRVALALQADGWILRQDIIWHKPNPMPESVRDRCTKAHEYIFLFSKRPRYYYDQAAILEPVSEATNLRVSQDTANQIGSLRANGGTRTDRPMKAVLRQAFPTGWDSGEGSHNGTDGNYHHKRKQAAAGIGIKNNEDFNESVVLPVNLRNKRSVWTVVTQGFSEAHFATFPEALITPCILAGCPEKVCMKCGKPRERVTEKRYNKRNRKNEITHRCHESAPSGNAVASVDIQTIGWSDCGCGAGFRRGIVLDPFMGAGTTGLVAYKHGRSYVGIELNPEYAAMADKRIRDEKNKYKLIEGCV